MPSAVDIVGCHSAAGWCGRQRGWELPARASGGTSAGSMPSRSTKKARTVPTTPSPARARRPTCAVLAPAGTAPSGSKTPHGSVPALRASR